jgi:hypothetical protein
MLKALIDRFLHDGYELAKEVALIGIIRRFSRGNTAVQDGQIMDEEDVKALRVDGDKAFRRLEKFEKRLASRTT